jgi:hypothetical protein
MRSQAGPADHWKLIGNDIWELNIRPGAVVHHLSLVPTGDVLPRRHHRKNRSSFLKKRTKKRSTG